MVHAPAASADYVINELLDAETDRFHPAKAARPAASGAITTVPLPWLYDWFSIEPAGVTRLWPVPAVDGR